MDDDVPSDAERTGEGRAAPDPFGPLQDEQVSAAAEELRRLVDAGASSPEELRALAARIREQRELEESAWRAEVRPALIKSKKRRFSMRDLRGGDETRPSDGLGVGVAMGLLGGVLVLLVAATQSSFLWILLPVAAVLVYAYRQGKAESSPTTTADPPAEDTPD